MILKKFKIFAGLEVTGELDEQTVELMNTPRCGVKDKIRVSDDAKRKKRYALQGSTIKAKDNIIYWKIRYGFK